MRPLAIDLFCGLGGWTDGLLAEGYEVIGFDVEQHVYGEHRYPAQLVLQDVLTLHGSQFRYAALIVASPPCQGYSYRAIPWKRAKALPPPDNSLFEACFRIQLEASEAAGHHIPLVVENVNGAQRWVGRAKWHFGSYYLWGDVPALMPVTLRSHGLKVPGIKLSEVGFNVAAAQRYREGIKQRGGGWGWFDNGITRHSSHSDSRKAASAQIAKIPFPLAQYIARVFKPEAGNPLPESAAPAPSVPALGEEPFNLSDEELAEENR